MSEFTEDDVANDFVNAIDDELIKASAQVFTTRLMTQDEARDFAEVLALLVTTAEVVDVWEAGDQEAVRLVHPELADALDKLAKADGR